MATINSKNYGKTSSDRLQEGMDSSANNFSEGMRQLLKGKQAQDLQAQKSTLERGDADANIARALGLKEKLEAGGEGKKYNIGIQSGGGVTFGESETDKLGAFLKGQQIQNLQEERDERRVKSVGERVGKDQIPEVISQLKDVEAALPPQGQPMKSYGPVKNIVPNWGISIGESLGLLPKGARRERQAMEAAKSMVRHPLYGSALTATEKGSFEDAFGAPIGGNEEDLRAAVNRMKEIPHQSLKNIEASSDPRAVSTYRERGGISSEQVGQMLPVNDETAKKKARLEELRMRKKQRLGQ